MGKKARASGGSKKKKVSSSFSRAKQPSEVVEAWDRGMVQDEAVSGQIDELESALQELAQSIGFDDHYRAVNDIEQGIAELSARAATIRENGYRYQKYLENKISVLEDKWQAAESAIRGELRKAENELTPLYDQAVRRFNGLVRGEPTSTRISSVASEIERVATQVEQTESTLRSTYSNIRSTFYQTDNQLAELEWMYEQLSEASFSLLGGEGAVHAVRSEWSRDDGDEPEGILYLTDQRLLFEQKEKVATKKVLFIATEKEMVQQLVFEADMVGLDAVKAIKKGLMGGQQHIEFVFTGSATLPTASFHIKGQSADDWAKMAERVQTGGIISERWANEGEEGSPEMVEESFANAPETCTSCGAPLPELAATQRQHECEYCGSVMRW